MEFVNVVAIAPSDDDVREHAPAARMRTHYESRDERLTRFLGYSDDRVAAWALNHRTPFPAWHHGHVALLGDSCHAILPYVPQGASQSIEDGLVLAEQIAKAVRGELTVADALAGNSDRCAAHAGVLQTGALNNRALPPTRRSRSAAARRRVPAAPPRVGRVVRLALRRQPARGGPVPLAT
ncbi:6-hydroxynicotinate 3-monooxygenase precursor [Actinomadura rubteroloni]|uniref:6-hydroxynicotinate 3-monooxygenase n=1 Tax=Actinomadura rubteroloni TaxID=1926885 RepID=A0A2P4UQK2_9ACTN|nr:FAD-dependent monooxygenase [Actinomadura rubteroloni]POM27331.1 6-hydroxynicotinate 3-monooxygenase precursor [Actinomadura rubteroloni]